MSKTRSAVVFTKNNARVVWYDSLDDLKEFSNVMIGADLSHVTGTPPHFWKVSSGMILPMTPEEKDARVAAINKDGIENDPKYYLALGYEAQVAKEARVAKEAEAAKEAEHESKHSAINGRISSLIINVGEEHKHMSELIAKVDLMASKRDQELQDHISCVRNTVQHNHKVHTRLIILSHVISVVSLIVSILRLVKH